MGDSVDGWIGWLIPKRNDSVAFDSNSVSDSTNLHKLNLLGMKCMPIKDVLMGNSHFFAITDL